MFENIPDEGESRDLVVKRAPLNNVAINDRNFGGPLAFTASGKTSALPKDIDGTAWNPHWKIKTTSRCEKVIAQDIPDVSTARLSRV